MPADDNPQKNKFWADAQREIEKCEALPNKEGKIECIYNLLYKITRAQDITNLTIREIINDDEDERWIPIHIADDANAILLGISRNQGKPELIIDEGYTGQKINALGSKWFMLRPKRK